MRYVLLSAAIMLLCGICLAQEPFDQCGIIESEVLIGPCYRINVIGGDYYELAWEGPLDTYVGDTVRVFGNFVSSTSVCMYGICCVYVDSIVACPKSTAQIPASGSFGILILCLILILSGVALIYRRFRTTPARYDE
jgi:hypothetical protein